MLYTAKPGQVSYGEAVGILLLDSCAPFIPGDVANASTYPFPVRFRRVPGLSVERIFNHDMSLLSDMKEAALELEREGVKAITGDCGFMAIYQRELADTVDIPVFMSSLLQIPFMEGLTGENGRIGILTANAKALNDDVFKACGVDFFGKLVIRGLEEEEHFAGAFIRENGVLDTDKVEAEVVEAVRRMTEDDPGIRMILLECSVLPPYAEAVQRETGLPVFDFVTMINYVFTAVVKRGFSGFM